MSNSKPTNIPLIVAAIFLIALPFATAQSPAPTPLPPFGAAPSPFSAAPSPGLDCFTYLLNLSDCLTFVQADSNLTKPDPGCCSELSNLVDTQPICLCQLLGNPGQVGLTIDVNRALKLPNVCNVTTPPVSLCAAIGIPVGAPAASEGQTAGGPVAASPSPGGDDSAVSPSSFASKSKQHFLVGLAAVLFTYLF